MKPKHLEIEKAFYNNAYSEPATRLQRGYGWATTPSPSMIMLFEKHVSKNPSPCRKILDIGIGADGRNAKYLLGQGKSVLGVDISENALKYCAINLKEYPSLTLKNLDLSAPDALNDCGKFDLIIDWSVMDHIRRAYLPSYKRNIVNGLETGGFLITSQFAHPLPDKFRTKKNLDYHLWNNHYMRSFTIGALIAEFPSLNVVDYLENCAEDEVNGIKAHAVLFQKSI